MPVNVKKNAINNVAILIPTQALTIQSVSCAKTIICKFWAEQVQDPLKSNSNYDSIERFSLAAYRWGAFHI